MTMSNPAHSGAARITPVAPQIRPLPHDFAKTPPPVSPPESPPPELPPPVSPPVPPPELPPPVSFPVSPLLVSPVSEGSLSSLSFSASSDADLCPEQLCVGTVPFAKYSVREGQPFTASNPVCVQIVFCSTEDGIEKSLYSSPSWTRSIIFFHNVICQD